MQEDPHSEPFGAPPEPAPAPQEAQRRPAGQFPSEPLPASPAPKSVKPKKPKKKQKKRRPKSQDPPSPPPGPPPAPVPSPPPPQVMVSPLALAMVAILAIVAILTFTRLKNTANKDQPSVIVEPPTESPVHTNCPWELVHTIFDGAWHKKSGFSLNFSRASSVCFVPPNALCSAYRDGLIEILDVDTGQVVQRLSRDGGTRDYIRVATSHDGAFVAAGDELGAVDVWEWRKASATPVCRFRHRTRSVLRDLAFHPNQPALASCGGEVRLWDPTTGSILQTFDEGETRQSWAHFGALAFSPTADQIAVGASTHSKIGRARTHHVGVYDLSRQKFLWPLTEPQRWIQALHYSSDGTRLIGASDDGKIWVWEKPPGDLLYTIDAHVETITVSPDGSLIVGAGTGDRIRFWSVERGEFLYAFDCSGQLISDDDVKKVKRDPVPVSLDFDSTGNTLLVGYADGRVRIFRSSDVGGLAR